MLYIYCLISILMFTILILTLRVTPPMGSPILVLNPQVCPSHHPPPFLPHHHLNPHVHHLAPHIDPHLMFIIVFLMFTILLLMIIISILMFIIVFLITLTSF